MCLTGAVQPPYSDNITVTTVQSSTISVRWNSPIECGCINGNYEIWYSAQPNGTEQIKNYSIDDSTWECFSEATTSLDGLIPHTNYSIQVVALSEQGGERLYPRGQPLTVQTEEDSKSIMASIV